MKKNEDKIFTNLNANDVDWRDPLDDAAPRFGGVLPSDYNYMLAQQEVTHALAAIKKSAENDEVQLFRMNSMRAASKSGGVTLVANREKSVKVEAPIAQIKAKKRKNEEEKVSSAPKKSTAAKVEVVEAAKASQPDQVPPAASDSKPSAKSTVSLLASYGSSDEDDE